MFKKENMKRTVLVNLLTWIVAADFAATTYGQGSRPASTSILLKGESKGGILTLMPAPSANYPYVAVTNSRGDSAVSVIARLVHELTNSIEFVQAYGRNPVLEVEDNSLVLLGGGRADPSWIFGGTEDGFNIPAPPLALSASSQSNNVVLNWINPEGGYDWITVSYGGIPVVRLSGTSTQFVFEGQFGLKNLFNPANVIFVVQGSKDGAPSNGVGIRQKNYRLQESLMNVPFTKGIAPGFESWAFETASPNISFEQGNLPGMAPKSDVRQFEGKGFYQIIQGYGNFKGGVGRRFLGLTPGHTYRMGTRLNTLNTTNGNWSFSVHAAYNPASGEELTSAQMAGVAELPDGSSGPTAGQIAGYQSALTTRGNWITRSSGVEGPGKATGDITLPADATSITIWFRLEGTNASHCAVGVDSVTIEDLGIR